MQKEITCSIDTDVYDKLTIALHLNEENINEMFENSAKSYIAKTFGAVSQKYNNTKKQSADDRDYFGKAKKKIPIWSLKPNQYIHKIIRAFFMAEDDMGNVEIAAMERLCSDKTRTELYVPTFKNNYAQMKIDGPKSYGKIFEDDGTHVWIWQELEDVVRKYKDAFLA